MSKVMTKKEKNAVIRAMSGGGAPVKKRRQRKPRAQKSVQGPASKKPRPRRRRNRNGRALAAKGGTKNYANNKHSCVVSESEYIGELISGTGTPSIFASSVFPIQPGSTLTFPWLSKQAPQWEFYTFEYLEFFFKREVSEFATAGTTGKVILMADFDASDGPPLSKISMEDTDPHADGMPCQNISLVLDPKGLHPGGVKKYVRPGGLLGNSDIKTFDAGNMYFASLGIAAAATAVGELHVKYRVRFEKPVLGTTAFGAPANNTVALFQLTAGTTAATGVQFVFGGSGVAWALDITTPSSLGIVCNSGVFSVPSGNWNVDLVMTQNSSVSDNVVSTMNYTLGGQTQNPALTATSQNTLNATTTTIVFNVFMPASGTTSLSFIGTNTISAGSCTATGYCRFTLI